MEHFSERQSTTNQTKNRKISIGTVKKGEAAPTAPVFLRVSRKVCANCAVRESVVQRMRITHFAFPHFPLTQKTFELISTCDPAVASWSNDGLTFDVKEPKKFQDDFIPKYFKHNNFSSFVRQLNFYGFHKVKSDPLLIEKAETSEESKYWKFHHEKFQQGRPDLLNEIRKSNRTEVAEKHEVDALKEEIADLKEYMAGMKRDLGGLKDLVGSLLQGQQANQQHGYAPEAMPSKKMRFSYDLPYAVTSQNDFESRSALEQKQIPYTALSLDGNSNPFDDFASEPSMNKGPLPVLSGQHSDLNESIGLDSIFSLDETMLTSLLALDPFDEVTW
jgi:hypothetical protein